MSIVLQGSTSGSITLQEPAVAGSTTLTLPATTGNVVVDTATQTLTNKTLTSPTLTTPNIDSAQFATVSGTAPIYPCRAWVNFNGTSTVAIRASGNVTSITDNGTGDYTVNFTTAMPDVNYSVQAMGGRLPNGGGGGEKQSWCYVDNYTTSSVRVLNTQPSTTNFDQPSMFVEIIR